MFSSFLHGFSLGASVSPTTKKPSSDQKFILRIECHTNSCNHQCSCVFLSAFYELKQEGPSNSSQALSSSSSFLTNTKTLCSVGTVSLPQNAEDLHLERQTYSELHLLP